MSRTIFYSWQSDLPNKYNRGFIADILEKSVKEINKSEDYIIEFNIDRDTLGKTGSPDIVNTIFDKIQNSEIFICDISLINNNQEGKKTPNPNVLIELGYAASAVGWENIICLFNEGFGELKSLPFDIQHRRIITYSLNDLNNDKKIEIRNSLKLRLGIELNSLGTDELNIRRDILSVFKLENKNTIKIAIDKPQFWTLRLSESLLKSRALDIQSKIELMDNQAIYSSHKYLKNLEIEKWYFEHIHNFMNLNYAIKYIFLQEWTNETCVNPENANAIKIYSLILRFDEIINKFVEWELEIKSLIPPDELIPSLEKMCLWSRKTINWYINFPTELKSVFTSKVKSNITFKFPELDDIHIVSNEFQNYGNQF